MTCFCIQSIWVKDPDVRDSLLAPLVERFVLMDERHIVWVNGSGVGFLHNMSASDHSSSDCRYMFRKTRDEAMRDHTQWYTWVKDADGNYHEVIS